MANRKMEMLDATMQIVAEVGFENFSMKMVPDKIGVSEALLYKYYHTKEELLYSCYMSILSDIENLFMNFDEPEYDSKESLHEFFYELWKRYFDLFVDGKYRTIYYFAYRDSKYMQMVKDRDYDSEKNYFSKFEEVYKKTKEHSFKDVNDEYLWTYMNETTGLFARKIIKGELEDNRENRETVCKLIFGGISRIV